MKRLLLILFFISGIATLSHAQKEKFQSLFIYNFTKYIKWPDSYHSDRFVIGVIGNSNIVESLRTMATSKQKTGTGATIEIKEYSSINEIGDCNILFVGSDAVNSLGEIDSRTSAKPILIITDSPGLADKGSVINFVDSQGKIQFELNQSNASARGLVVSGSLSSLAILI